jgi:hypothetical protein
MQEEARTTTNMRTLVTVADSIRATGVSNRRRNASALARRMLRSAAGRTRTTARTSPLPLLVNALASPRRGGRQLLTSPRSSRPSWSGRAARTTTARSTVSAAQTARARAVRSGRAIAVRPSRSPRQLAARATAAWTPVRTRRRGAALYCAPTTARTTCGRPR